MIIWGFNFIPLKISLSELPPFTTAFLGVFNASIVLLILFRNKIKKYNPDIYFYIILSGFFGSFCFNLFLNLGMLQTSPTNASLIICSTPCWALIFNRILLKQKICKTELLAIPFSIFGVYMLITKGSAHSLSNIMVNKGDILVLISVISVTLYLVFAGKAMQRISPLVFTPLSLLSGSFFLLPLVIHEKPISSVQSIGINTILSIIYIFLVTNVGASLLINYGIKKTNIIVYSTFSNLIPLFTMLFSVLILNEIILPIQQKAALLIILSALIVSINPFLKKWRTNIIYISNKKV